MARPFPLLVLFLLPFPLPLLLCPVHLHNADDGLAAERAVLKLLGAAHARAHMPAVVKEAVHVLLVADLAQTQVVLGHHVLHAAAAVPAPVLEAADVRVARPRIHQRAVLMHAAGLPHARVNVAVVELHAAVALPLAQHEIAVVRVAVQLNQRALPVVLAVLARARVRAAGEGLAVDHVVGGEQEAQAVNARLEVCGKRREFSLLLKLARPN